MPKLRVTVQEARHLFHNFEEDLRKICEEEFQDFEGFSKEQNAEDFKNLWSVVDKEFRGVYETSRYGLEIQDLDEDITNIDVFRGYCEDVDGLEPRDGNLITKISQETQAIQDLLEHNAMYRVSIPAKVEEYFSDRVRAKRKLFDDIQSKRQPRDLGDKLIQAGEVLPPPNSLSDALEALKKRLKSSSAVIASLLG